MHFKLRHRIFLIFVALILPASLWAVDKNHTNNNKFEYYCLLLKGMEQVQTDTIRSTSTLRADTIVNDSLKKQKPLLDTEITYQSDDTMLMSLTGKKIFMAKNAFVKYGTIELKSYYIELDLDKKEAIAYGIKDSLGNFTHTPEFKDGSEEFKCEQLRFNFKTKKGLVYKVIKEEGEGFVHGETTKKINDKVFYLHNGKYTTCNHKNPHFYIKMPKAKLVKDDKIVSGPLYMVLEDVPLYPVGLPFALFPFSSKYSSGIIMPSYGEEKRRGFNLRGGGYYWAINEYMDLAVTGDIFTNGSWGANLRSSYKKRYRFSGNFQADYHFNKYGDKGLPDYYETKDFSVRWTHRQDPKANPYRAFSASVNFSTSQNDRNNAQSMDQIVNNRKVSSINYRKSWAGSPFSLNATLRHSQNSRDNTISLTLPSFSFNMTQIYPFRKKGKSANLKWYDRVGISYAANFENRINTKEDKLKSASLRKDWKNGYKHTIPITTNFKLTRDLTLSPTLNYQGVLYSRYINKAWDPTAGDGTGGVRVDTIQQFKYAHNYSTGASLSLSPKIYGMYTFSKKSKLAFIRHVMTPSISVSYTPEIGVPRSRYYKTYIDKSGGREREVEYSIFEGSLYGTPTGSQEAGSVGLSLDNNIEAKIRVANDTTGNEEFKKVKILESLRFSTSYNMFADSLKWSPVSISGRTKIFNQKLDVSFNGTVDPYKLSAANRKIDAFGPRLTSARVALGFSLASSDLEPKADDKDDKKKKWRDPRYVNFDIPWSFSIDYGWSYSKPANIAKIEQTMGVNGNFSLTPKWKMSFRTSYDITNKTLTATQFTVTRNLHCWQMSFDAIPFGNYQSFNFRINVQSNILQDLKYEKNESWQDLGY